MAEPDVTLLAQHALTDQQRLVMKLIRRMGKQRKVARLLGCSEAAVSQIRARAEQRALEFIQRVDGNGELGLAAAIAADAFNDTSN